MATAFHSSTPPPPSSLHSPNTPRFGFEDPYEPYSPRKSARVASILSRAAQTPPPRSHTSQRSSKRPTITSSPPSSPPTASKKRTPKSSPIVGGRRVSGALNFDNTATAAAALGLRAPQSESKMESRRSTATIRNNSMLPTPAKTPKKRPSETAPAITAIARNLFPIRGETVEEVMPSPKKKGRKRYTGFTLDSFEAEEEGEPIRIYTDSHDRVPEIDMSADNPFYGQGGIAQPEPTKRSSKRRKINVPGEGEQTIEEAEQREDGLVYVFRGKKIFRKFADVEETESQAQEHYDAEDAELDEIVPATLRRPLTRSSIKPRLLFPTPQQIKAKEKRSDTTEDEEEAITDIEEPNDSLSTPLDLISDVVVTPKAPKFAPASPPTTTRTTRSKKVDMGSAGQTSDDESIQSPRSLNRGRGGKLSPFDGWQRTKGSVGGSKKREGAPLTRGSGGSKKVRG